jgi:hypothetical protein
MNNMFNFIKSTKTIIKKFEYKKGNLSLSFNLGEKDLKDFLELLKVAQEDLEKEINGNL